MKVTFNSFIKEFILFIFPPIKVYDRIIFLLYFVVAITIAIIGHN